MLRPMAPPELSFAEQVVLALVETGATRGSELVRALGVDGPIGRIGLLSRPLTYRAVETLGTKGLLRRLDAAAGPQGRERVAVAVTASGRRAVARFLGAPVQHLREVRVELLVKLDLRTRAGLDNAAFLVEQRVMLEPILDALRGARSGGDLVADWRAEHAAAVERFLDRAIGGVRSDALVAGQGALRISARNRLRGTIRKVQRGELLASVTVALPDGQQVTAVITNDAVDDLDLVRGDEVAVVVKSTEVMIAKAMP
jgi:molybdopterin-binding protein